MMNTSKKLSIGITAALLVFPLAGIFGLWWTPTAMYYQPYGMAVYSIQDSVYVEFVPVDELRLCGAYDPYSLMGCAVERPTTLNGRIWDIQVADNLTAEFKAETLEHEYAHVYEQLILGVSLQDAANHVGWHTKPQR